jgi:DNA-directed RNA polymerase subunit K/omega
MAIKTIDIEVLANHTGNIFKSLSVVSRRARQVSSRLKAELDNKLAYYEGFEPELEDPRFQEEQLRTSLEYELKPKPTQIAIDEMFSGDVYFRDSNVDLEA